MSGFLSVMLRRRGFDTASGPRTVLSGLSFDVTAGERVVVLGASGCGKSTLLRIIAGLDTGYDGRVSLGGELIVAPTPRVGLMFQEPRLLPWLTVARNVSFGLPDEPRSGPRVAALLAEVGLDGFVDVLPKTLSGGQAQRVALARALVREPGLLLLDEPFSALDAITRARLQRLVLRVAAIHRTALLLVTHDIDEALAIGDRVLLLPVGGGAAAEFRVPHQDSERARLKNEILARLGDEETPAVSLRTAPAEYEARP